MKEQQDNLQPETLDYLIEGGELLQQDRQTTRLLQHLQLCAEDYARENERSLERVWNQLLQQQEHAISPGEQKPSPEKDRAPIVDIKERNVLQSNQAAGEMASHGAALQPKKRNAFWKVIGTTLVAAVAIITILSFANFSGLLHPVSPSTATGAPGGAKNTGETGSVGQQQAQLNAKLVCNFSAGNKVTVNGAMWTPALSWSSQGQIAVATYTGVQAASAQNCKSTSFSQRIAQNYEAHWSPDGSKLAFVSAGDNSIYVLDTHGNTVVHLSNSQLGKPLGVGNLLWSSDSKKIIFAFITRTRTQLMSIALNSNASPTTVFTLPTNSGIMVLSPDGRYALLSRLDIAARTKVTEIWSINNQRKIVSLDPTFSHSLGWAFSPDGSLLAVGGKIVSTSNGSVQATLPRFNVDNLTWSPDGKYIAGGTSSILVYNVQAKNLVATFGTVDANHSITSLEWAPDSKGLVSSTTLLQSDVPSDDMVNVWSLR